MATGFGRPYHTLLTADRKDNNKVPLLAQITCEARERRRRQGLLDGSHTREDTSGLLSRVPRRVV